MQIESGRVVQLLLTITDTTTGKTLQKADTSNPLLYLHGHDDLEPALEGIITGMEDGEAFDDVIEDAFGPAPSQEPTPVPKREFPKNWPLAEGFRFLAGGSEGNQAKLYVHAVRGSRVHVSPEHPWGGRAIRFSGEILNVRNATLDERNHGHAHGPGGHHH